MCLLFGDPILGFPGEMKKTRIVIWRRIQPVMFDENPSPPLVDPIRHVITDPIYPYPYRVVITTLVAEQLDTYPDL